MSKNCSCNYYLFRIWGVVYFVYERPRLGLGCTLFLVLCKNVGNSNLLNLELITSFSSFLHHHHRNTAGPDVALGIGWLYFHPQNSYFFAVSTFFSKNGLKKKENCRQSLPVDIKLSKKMQMKKLCGKLQYWEKSAFMTCACSATKRPFASYFVEL